MAALMSSSYRRYRFMFTVSTSRLYSSSHRKSLHIAVVMSSPNSDRPSGPVIGTYIPPSRRECRRRMTASGFSRTQNASPLPSFLERTKNDQRSRNAQLR